MGFRIFSQGWGGAKGQSKLMLNSILSYYIFCSYFFFCAAPVLFYGCGGGSHIIKQLTYHLLYCLIYHRFHFSALFMLLPLAFLGISENYEINSELSYDYD